jgi:hypothetical protein
MLFMPITGPHTTQWLPKMDGPRHWIGLKNGFEQRTSFLD